MIILSIIFTSQLLAQPDTIYVPSDIMPGEGNLNLAVQNEINKGSISNTVFKLELNGYYVLTDSILVPLGEHLTIVAPEPGTTQVTAPPQILISTSYTSKYNFYSNGNITMRNIWLLYAASDGWQRHINLQFDSPDVNEILVGDFENVIFDYSAIPANGSGTVGISSKHFKGFFKNCYWKNCTDNYFTYYGRAVSFPYLTGGYHIDSLTFENCTFANIGYVFSQQQSYDGKFNYADYVKFNHCTFLNTVKYTLQSGWWYKMSVTNSIFVNAYMYGDIPAVNESYGTELNGGTIRIDSISTFGFEVPFVEQDRRILFTNSSYFIEKWLSNWMYINPYSVYLRNIGQPDLIPQPQPMLNPRTLKFFGAVNGNGKKEFPFMNESNLFNEQDPSFIDSPSDTVLIKSFLYKKWGVGTDESWAYKPELSVQHKWPLEENLTYTNTVLLNAGMSGFHLGDLYRWFPGKYKQWKAQQDLENDRITTWLETGKDKYTSVRENNKEIPFSFSLEQNYPNPFNPSTKIKFSIPEQSFVTLTIYDILGRKILTLLNEEKPCGTYEVEFNKAELVSGVYFYSIVTAKFYQTKKFILLK